MVTILSVGLTDESGTEQERITSPLMCTEQAPHCAMPQPNLVPVSPICSRITHSSGVSGSACTSRVSPLTLSIAMRFLRGGSLLLVAQAPARRSVEKMAGAPIDAARSLLRVAKPGSGGRKRFVQPDRGVRGPPGTGPAVEMPLGVKRR